MFTRSVLKACAVAVGLLSPLSFAAAQEASPTITVPTLDVKGVEMWSEKREIYVDIYNETLRIPERWQEYENWFKIGGPLSKRNGGFSETGPTTVEKIGDLAKKAVSLKPEIAELDKTVQEMAQLMEKMGPLSKKAYGYYARKDYVDDEMAEGLALHPQLVAVYVPFVKAHARLEELIKQLDAGLSKQQQDALAQVEGKKYRWHITNAAQKAEAVMQLMPKTLQDPVDDAKLKAAVKEYAEAVKEHDAYKDANQVLGKETAIGAPLPDPTSLLSDFRGFAEEYAEAREKNMTAYKTRVERTYRTYNRFVSAMNSIRFIEK